MSRLLAALKYTAYVAGGRRPFTTGYGVYKQRRIADVLSRATFDPDRLPPGYGVRLDERVVEYPWLFSRLPRGAGRLLDAGSVLNFAYLLAQPALAEKRIFISTLAPEHRWEPARPNVSYIYEDLRESCFREGYFDWIVSLSTLEHIGMDNARFYAPGSATCERDPRAYLAVVRELRRVLKLGGVLYASVPFGRQADHGWLQVFDAAMIDGLLDAFGPISYIERHFRYERNGWRVSSREASREATYFDYHRARRHDRDCAAAARAVVCLELRG